MRNPRVDVVKLQDQLCSPFFAACQEDHPDVVSMLLADLRVDFNRPKSDGATPF